MDVGSTGAVTCVRMRIVTNPGSNLGPAMLARYGIDLSPQQIVVDGVSHDTRVPVTLAEVDAWIAGAKQHPYVLGTSAAEFARLFQELGRDDPEILAVMTSRKLIQSHDAAMSASRTVSMHARQPLCVRVIDTGITEIGTGLVSLMAALGRDAGIDLESLGDILERFSSEAQLQLHVASMDNLMAGGQASFLRGWLANIFQVRPILTLRAGELAVAQKVSTRIDPVETLVSAMAEAFGRRPVWAGVVHGDVAPLGRRLLAALRERLDVVYGCLRPFSAGVYTHVGRGALGCFVLPIDALGWTPPVPESLGDDA